MAKTPKLTVDSLQGIVGYMPTPVREDIAIDRNAKNAINLDEAARVADCFVNEGLCAVALNGTFGELPSLTRGELQSFTAAVVDAVAGRVPVFAGATTLNTRDTIERAKVFADIGADGLMLGRPMMSPLSDENIVQYYRDVAEEVPELAIFMYDDMEAFKRPISTRVYGQLAEIPQIIGCKYRSRLLLSGVVDNSYNADLDAVNGRIKLMPVEVDWHHAWRLFDMDSCWSSAVSGGPAPVQALHGALLDSDWAAAKLVTGEICWTYEGIVPNHNFEVWHVDKIPFMKARFAAAEYMTPGPALPPYQYISPDRLAIAEELGRRSRQLQEKYSAQTLAAE